MSTFTIQLNTEPRIFEVLSALFQKLRFSEPPFVEDDASIVDAAPTTTTTATSTITSTSTLSNSTSPPPTSTQTAKNNTKSPTKSTSPTPKQTANTNDNNNIAQKQLQTIESSTNDDNNSQMNSISHSAVTNELTVELTKMFNKAISSSPISSSHSSHHTMNTNSSGVSAFASATINNHNTNLNNNSLNNSNSSNSNNNTSMFSSLGLSGEIQVLAQILNPIVRSNTSTTSSASTNNNNNNNSQSLSSQQQPQQNNATTSSASNSHFNHFQQRGYILHYPPFDLGVKRTLHQALSLLKRINEIMIATQTGTITSSFRNLTLFFGIIQSLSIHCNSNTADLLPLIAAETFLIPVLRLYSVFREQQEKRELGNTHNNNNNNNNSRQNQLQRSSSSSASPLRNNSNSNNNNNTKTIKPSIIISSMASKSSVVDAELRAAHEKLKKRNFTVEFDEFKKRAKQLFGARDETALASLRDSFCVEFLLDCVLPPAVCSARFDALQAFAYERKASFASIVLQMKAVTSLVIRSGSMSHINCAMLLGLYAETKNRFKLLEKMLQEGLLTRVLAALNGETGAPQLLLPSTAAGMNSGTLSAASSPKLVVPVTTATSARFSASPKTLSKPPLSISHGAISSQQQQQQQQQQQSNIAATTALGIPVHEQVPELISASLNPAQKRLKNLTTALEALVYLSTLAQQEEYSEIANNSTSSSSPKNENRIFLGSSVSLSSSSSSSSSSPIVVDRVDIALQSIAIPSDAQGFLCWCYSENISQIIDVAFSILQEPQKALHQVVVSSLQENQQHQLSNNNNNNNNNVNNESEQHHAASPKQKANWAKSPAPTKSNISNSASFVISKSTLETVANLSSSFIVQSLRLRSKILYQVLRKVDELFDRILPSSVSELVPVLVAIIDCGDKIAANVDKQEMLVFQEQQQKLQQDCSATNNNKNAKGGSPLTVTQQLQLQQQQSRLSTNNASVSRPSFANNNSQSFIQAGFVTQTVTSAVNSDLEVLMEQKKIVQDIQRYVAEWFFSLSRHVGSIAKKLVVSTNTFGNLQENRRRTALDLVPHFRLWLNVLPILLRGEKEGLLHFDSDNINNYNLTSSSTVIASSPFATQQVATAIENYGVTVLEVAQFVSAPGATGRRLCPPLVQSVALAVLNAHAAYHPDIQREQQNQKEQQRLLASSASKKDTDGNTPNSKLKSPSPTGAKKNAKPTKSASPSPPPKSLFEIESVALILQTIPEKPEAKFYASSSQQLRLVTSRSQTMRVQRSPSSNRFASSPTKTGKSKVENNDNNNEGAQKEKCKKVQDEHATAASPEQTLGVILGISNSKNNNTKNKNNNPSRLIMMHQTAAMEAASSPKQAGARRGRSSSNNNDSENQNNVISSGTSGMKMMDLKTFSFDGGDIDDSVTSPTISTSQQNNNNNNNKGGNKTNGERLSNVLFSSVALGADDAGSNSIAKGKATPDSVSVSRGKNKTENNNNKHSRTKEDVALFQDDDAENDSNSDDAIAETDDDDDDDEESIAALLRRGKQKNQELGRPSPTQKTGRKNKNLITSSSLLNNKYTKKELIPKSSSSSSSSAVMTNTKPSNSIIATAPKRKSASSTTGANIIANKPQIPLSPVPNRTNPFTTQTNSDSSPPPPPTGMFGRISAAIKSLTSSPVKESSSNNNGTTNIQTLLPPKQPNINNYNNNNNNQERSIFDIDSAINSPRVRRSKNNNSNNDTNQVDSAASPLATTSRRSGTVNNNTQEQNAPIPWTQRLSGLFRF